MSKRRMKGILLASSFLCFGMVAGIVVSCGETVNETVKLTSIAISNKAELQAEWHVGEVDREVKFTIAPDDFNLTSAIKDGTVNLSSSDSSIVVVQGRFITPLKAGTVTITVTANELTDSVELTVLEAITEPDVITGKTVADMLALSADATQLYEVEGYISAYNTGKTYFTTYGNFFIVDDLANPSENSILVYGCTAKETAYTYGGGTYVFTNPADWQTNTTTSSIALFDKVKLRVNRLDYGTTKELQGVFIEKTGTGTPSIFPEPEAVTGENATIANFIADTEGNKKKLYKGITGTITKWYGTNTNANASGYFYIADSTGTELLVYGATAVATSLTWNESGNVYAFNNPKDFLTNAKTKNLIIGSTVTLDLVRADYKEVIEGTGILTSSVDIVPTSITISSEEVNIPVDGTTTISVETVPAAISVPLTYVSSDPLVATVDENGKVTGVSKGTADITVAYGETVVSNALTITVTDPIKPTAITISGEAEVALTVGDIKKFIVTTTPEVIEVELSFKSSDETVLSIDNDGNAEALVAGTAKVTAYFGEVVSNEITVTVTGDPLVAHTYNFKDFGSTSTVADATEFATSIKGKIVEGETDIIESVADGLSKVYYGQSGYTQLGIKMGTSSAKGTFTLNLTTSIKKVKVVTIGWIASDSLTVNDVTKTSGLAYNYKNAEDAYVANDPVELTYSFTASKIVTFTSNFRSLIQSISFLG